MKDHGGHHHMYAFMLRRFHARSEQLASNTARSCNTFKIPMRWRVVTETKFSVPPRRQFPVFHPWRPRIPPETAEEMERKKELVKQVSRARGQ